MLKLVKGFSTVPIYKGYENLRRKTHKSIGMWPKKSPIRKIVAGQNTEQIVLSVDWLVDRQ